MKLLEEKRDELAKEYSLAKYPVQNIETRKDFTQDVNFARRMSHCQAFQDGFDACLKELEPVIKDLLSDMQYMAADDIDIADVPSEVRSYILRARKALQKYKQLTGEK